MEARQQQQARNKALKMGVNEDEMVIGKFPVSLYTGFLASFLIFIFFQPKILVASRFDRQIDRRNYGDKRELFENVFIF